MSDNNTKFWDAISKYRLDAPPPSDGVKIVDLYQKIENDILDLSPDFQRKLVWKDKHKFNFIKTILMNFPFPEVYIASKDIDVDEKTAIEIVVDGKQRLTTICDYINGEGVFNSTNKVIPLFVELETSKKKAFLNYKVTVRDLKDVNEEHVDEIFRRINSTEYPLNKMELVNSEFGDSEFLCFSKQLVDQTDEINFDNIDFIIDRKFCLELQECMYVKWGIYPERDRDRMFVLMSFMNMVISILESSYHGRNGSYAQYVEKFNSDFPLAEDVISKMMKSFSVIKELEFQKGSFFHTKSMFFTLMVEFGKIEFSLIDMKKLKDNLNELEGKHGIFLAGRLNELSSEEKIFFEFTRNSMNEKRAREVRGDIVQHYLKLSFK